MVFGSIGSVNFLLSVDSRSHSPIEQRAQPPQIARHLSRGTAKALGGVKVWKAMELEEGLHQILALESCCCSLKWRFPKIGVPPNHPMFFLGGKSQFGGFLEWGYPKMVG